MLLLLLPQELLATSRVEVYREGQRFEPAPCRFAAVAAGGLCGLAADWLPLPGRSSAEWTSSMTDSALSPTSALSMDLRHPPP